MNVGGLGLGCKDRGFEGIADAVAVVGELVLSPRLAFLVGLVDETLLGVKES